MPDRPVPNRSPRRRFRVVQMRRDILEELFLPFGRPMREILDRFGLPGVPDRFVRSGISAIPLAAASLGMRISASICKSPSPSASAIHSGTDMSDLRRHDARANCNYKDRRFVKSQVHFAAGDGFAGNRWDWCRRGFLARLSRRAKLFPKRIAPAAGFGAEAGFAFWRDFSWPFNWRSVSGRRSCGVTKSVRAKSTTPRRSARARRARCDADAASGDLRGRRKRRKCDRKDRTFTGAYLRRSTRTAISHRPTPPA